MNILVVSPHPDDETLGAGGTILRLMQEGNAVSWLNITGIQGIQITQQNIERTGKDS